MSNLPEVGSTWLYNGLAATVIKLGKKGRGYYIIFTCEGSHPDGVRMRLKDFQKKAVPA